MRALASIIAVVVLLIGGPAAAAAASIHSLDWLVGHTWRADASVLGGPVSHIDVRYEWAETANYVHFSTKFFAKDDSVVRRYSGNFFYDPSDSQIRMWYVDDAGQIVQGPLSIADNAISMSFTEPDDRGKSVDYRVDLTRRGDAEYIWELFAQTSKGWTKQFSLDYKRLD